MFHALFLLENFTVCLKQGGWFKNNGVYYKIGVQKYFQVFSK